MCQNFLKYKMSSSELPFFPKHETIQLEKNKLRITWFETKFCQCQYNFQDIPTASNACTLIAVLMTSYCRNEKIIMNAPHQYLNGRLIYLLAYSILDGNKIHDTLKATGCLDHYNLTVPEALKYAGPRVEGLAEWKSLIYMEPLLHTLYTNIKANWIEWMKHKSPRNKSDLYVILIADNRSVLFIIQKQSDTVTLIDSHQHSEDQGAFIAVAALEKLNLLCLWFCHIIHQCYKCDPGLYELSFLHFPY